MDDVEGQSEGAETREERDGNALPEVLRHLARLTGSFPSGGRRIAYIHAYARSTGPAPGAPLEFLVARESGFEGIACVDDVARAAILALQVYEQTGSAAAMRTAQAWLGFAEYMQEGDGGFANFIRDATGVKNHGGKTSYVGGSWWTARARWALATAWRVTGEQCYLDRYVRSDPGVATPGKVLGIQILGLLELYRVRPTAALREEIGVRCDAILAHGPSYFRDRPGQKAVASWGYRQLQAVARAARLLDRLEYRLACEATVRT